MKRFISIAIILVLSLSFSLTAFAANDNDIIPADGEEKVFVASSSEAANQPSSSKTETASSSQSNSESVFTKPPELGDEEAAVEKPKDYTNGIFYKPELDIEKSEAKPFNKQVSRVASFVIAIVVNILPLGIVIFTLVDIMCLLFPPILWFMSNIVPIQLYSPEVASITGVSFGGKEGGGGGGGSKADLDGKNPIFFYARQRVGVIFVALLIVVLIVSGAWWTIMSWLINLIVGWIMSFL